MSLQSGKGRLRIIGGSWRGRKLDFPDIDGLRPTADRTRETLFNWLHASLGGADCLDLFAGSGALGFEAASRGAKKVVLVEQDRRVADQLVANKALLSASQCDVVQRSAAGFLATDATPFDIVFIDPPFDADLWKETIEMLIARAWLAPQARVYMEYPRKMDIPMVPENWTLMREKTAGAVKYCLFTVEAET